MLIFDVETDGLLDTLTTIHSLVIYDTEKDELISCCNTGKYPNAKTSIWTVEKGEIIYQPIWYGLNLLQQAKEIAGHNIIKFDIPAIQKVFPSFKYTGKLYDTMLVSKLAFPDIGELDDKYIRKGVYPASVKQPNKKAKTIRGSYSLFAWGYRLGEYKGDYCEQDEAWTQWSVDMQRYCEQDVKVTTKLYELLKKKPIPENVIELEQQFAHIIGLQEQRGVGFDYPKAVELAAQLNQQFYDLTKELKEIFPPEIKVEVFIPKVNNKARGYVKGQPFTKKTIIEFNPASRQMVAERLIKKYNWKPTAKTDTGQPKIDESVLETLDFPEAPKLRDYFLLQKILGYLTEGTNAWLKLYNPKTKGIHGSVDTAGAVTGRCTHNKPNLANIPACDAFMGKECRSLFKARDGYTLVGCDASGLELRCLAHYMNDEDYTNEILNGDIHTKNQMAAGLPTRNNAKTFIYGFLYGAGDAKIGSITGKGAKEGKEIKKKFLTSLPSLSRLSTGVREKIKTRGYLKGIDGRKLKVREQYKGLNVLLQSAGAIVMKKALCILYDDCLAKGWKINDDFAFVLNVHDEYQAEVKPELVEEYKVMAVEAIRKAGKALGFKCPLDGEAKIGLNWCQTH